MLVLEKTLYALSNEAHPSDLSKSCCGLRRFRYLQWLKVATESLVKNDVAGANALADISDNVL
jgi:hypothetical protein